MELSCKTEYILLALIELASSYHSGQPLQARAIASRQQIPDRYLEQLLAMLRRSGFVNSQRGVKGGYLLARSPQEITLLEIFCQTEGFEQPTPTETETNCAKTMECLAVQEVWTEARQAAIAILSRYTLKDLLEKRDLKQQMGLMYYI